MGQVIETRVRVDDPELEQLHGTDVVVVDLGVEQTRTREWVVTKVAVRSPRRLGRRSNICIVNCQNVQGLARVRDPGLTPALASMAFVARPPTATPTGRYLGCVHLQRLLREPPAALVSGIVDTDLPSLNPALTLSRHWPQSPGTSLPTIWSADRLSTTRTTCWALSASTMCSIICCPTIGACASRKKNFRPALKG